MKRIFRIIIFYIPAISYHLLFGQNFNGELPYKHYTTKDGLAGSNALSFLQDKNGYIWFATSNGLSKFDGTEFKNYSKADGLLSNNLTGIAQSGDSTILVSTYDQGVNIIERGKISDYKINNSGPPLIHHMMEYKGHIYIYGDYFSEIYKNKLNKIITRSIDRGRYKINDINVFDLKINDADSSVLIFSFRGVYRYKNHSIKLISTNKYYSCYELNNHCLLGAQGHVDSADYNFQKIRYNYINIKRNNQIQCLLVDINSDVWFATVNHGLYCYKNGRIINVGKSIGLEKTQVNFIKMDNENNIWVGTYGKGVYCFFNLGLTNFTTKDGLNNNFVTSIVKDQQDRINIGTINGIDILDNNHVDHISTSKQYQMDYIREIVPSTNDNIYVVGTVGNSKNDTSKILKIKNGKITYQFINAATIAIDNNVKLLYGGWTSIVLVYSDINNELIFSNEFYISQNHSEIIKTNKIFILNRNIYWFGTSKGLIILNNNKLTHSHNNKILSGNITVITMDKKGEIWVGGSEGLLVNKNKKWSEILNSDSSSISEVTSIAFVNKDVWIGTFNGLYVLSNGTVRKISSDWGLISNEIHSLFYDKDTNILWIGTNDGISRVDFNIMDLYPEIKLKVYVTQIKSNKTTYSPISNLQFNSDENNIAIRLSIPYFRNDSPLLYEYTFGNDNPTWNETKKNELEFASLSPGVYNLRIRGRTLDGNISDPKIISFIIATPFTESSWFYSLIILGTVISAIFITRVVISKKHKKYEEKKNIENKILDLRQQALNAMMNPHFIFNSLNSIQNFINRHNKTEANEYLAKFAKLIRKNFDSAQEGFITLQEEIERLKLYLSLEKMRFGENFNYSIVVDDKINSKDILLPNMIIQPFVENSIWHGILPGTKAGNVSVKFVDDNSGNLIIYIIDDGIGFKQKANKSKTNHKPRGINLIRERLELLNKDREITNILNIKSGKGGGTTVEIILPMMNQNNMA
jgi:ligand-binding sensor domain-containing protein